MPGRSRSIHLFRDIAEERTPSLSSSPSDPSTIQCYICGKVQDYLLHPDELQLQKFPKDELILCNYCHRPICVEHISTNDVPKLQEIRIQHFCVNCGETLAKDSKGNKGVES